MTASPASFDEAKNASRHAAFTREEIRALLAMRDVRSWRSVAVDWAIVGAVRSATRGRRSRAGGSGSSWHQIGASTASSKTSTDSPPRAAATYCLGNLRVTV